VGVDQREEHAVDAQADAKDEDRGEREPAIAPQHAQGEPRVLDEQVQDGKAALLAMCDAQAVDPAELAHRGKPSVGIRQAIPLQVGCEELEVMLDLPREAIVAPSMQDDFSDA
jgi:hypothetical protein